ncbi:MAG: dTMP kinase [Vampirovibrionales bacterium]|nr:dTMP kinase [Vampirovibrionales bacterium]
MSLFVTFEGMDGSGKSTQAQRCYEALVAVGIPVLLTKNPGGTALGSELRNILLHTQSPITPKAELLLYIADRVQHLEEVVKPALTAGTVVLCDRFSDSTLAYQGYGRGLDVAWIGSLHQLAFNNVQPDVTLLFEGPVETLLARAKGRSEADRLEREAVDFYERIASGFNTLAAQYPNRIQRLDATLPLETLHEQVVSTVMARLKQPVAQGWA